MVSWNPATRQMIINDDGTTSFYGEGSCLSTDAKPTTGVANGSTLLEMNTSKVFAFDADSATWKEL